MIKLNKQQIHYLEKALSSFDFEIKNDFINNIIKEYKMDIGAISEKPSVNSLEDIMIYTFDKKNIKEFGITFTPIDTVKMILDEILGDNIAEYKDKRVLDPSIGTGNFIIGYIIKQKELNPSFRIIDFIENNLYGFDIKEENVFFCKLNLTLLSLFYGEDSKNISFNIQTTDTIKSYITNDLPKEFDLIIGNPPYVKQQNLDKSYRNILTSNFETIYSNYNLYYAFVELSLSLLNQNGRIIYLIPNYLLKIKSAEMLRKMLIKGNWFENIIDFETNKIFPGIDTYSMVLSLKQNSDVTLFKVIKDPQVNIKDIVWNKIKIDETDSNSIDLVTENDKELIDSVISQPNSLIISTGIATLKDKVYLIDYINNEGEFIKIYNDKHYKIEAPLVKKIIKGSGQSKNSTIKEQYIIFPYFLNHSGKASLIPFHEILDKYPITGNYFLAVKQELLSRSGNYRDDNWHQYGRSQSLSKFHPKIIFPTNTGKPNFKYFTEEALFYNGYAILGLENHTNTDKLFRVLCLILNSDIIDRFMKLTSYYIGGGYVSYQKKYLSRVKIPNLNDSDVSQLLKISDSKEELNEYIYQLYRREKTNLFK